MKQSKEHPAFRAGRHERSLPHTHVRSYDRAEFIYNPLHYLALLEQKSKALDQAAPLDEWRSPIAFIVCDG